MKRQLILSAILLFCLASTVVAASSRDSLQVKKIAMIKEGIYFYSYITELNKNPNTPISDCLGEDTATLMKCAKQLEASAQTKVRSWFTLSINTAADLQTVRDKIITDVTARNKGERETLPAYNTLRNHLNILANISDSGQPETDTRNAKADSILKITIETAVKTAMHNNTPWRLYFMAGLAVILAAAALYIAYKGSKKTTSSSTGGFGRGTSSSERYMQLKSEVFEKLTKMDSEINNMKVSLMENQDKIAKQIRLSQERNDDSYNKVTPLAPSEMVSHSTSNNQKLYAKIADGNAFDVDLLSTEQDNRMVYELTVKSKNTATYTVTSNKEAQLLALEDAGLYLRRACDYSGQPKSDSRIVTKTEGTLQLEGGKWKITKLAIIDFE